MWDTSHAATGWSVIHSSNLLVSPYRASPPTPVGVALPIALTRPKRSALAAINAAIQNSVQRARREEKDLPSQLNSTFRTKPHPKSLGFLPASVQKVPFFRYFTVGFTQTLFLLFCV